MLFKALLLTMIHAPVRTELRCPKPQLIPYHAVWDDDLALSTIRRATKTCAFKYKGCLIRLERDDMDFKATCQKP